MAEEEMLKEFIEELNAGKFDKLALMALLKSMIVVCKMS